MGPDAAGDVAALTAGVETGTIIGNGVVFARDLVNIPGADKTPPMLADQVATELAAHDALAAHARDELGITEHNRAQPPDDRRHFDHRGLEKPDRPRDVQAFRQPDDHLLPPGRCRCTTCGSTTG